MKMKKVQEQDPFQCRSCSKDMDALEWLIANSGHTSKEGTGICISCLQKTIRDKVRKRKLKKAKEEFFRRERKASVFAGGFYAK